MIWLFALNTLKSIPIKKRIILRPRYENRTFTTFAIKKENRGVSAVSPRPAVRLLPPSRLPFSPKTMTGAKKRRRKENPDTETSAASTSQLRIVYRYSSG